MGTMTSTSTCLGIALTGLFVVGQPRVDGTIRLELHPSIPVDEREVSTLLDVARAAGVGSPTALVTKYHGMNCRITEVRSTAPVAEHRVRTRRIFLRRSDWRPCDVLQWPASRQTGEWIAYPQTLSVEERWRVVREDAHVDVAGGEGVALDVVEAIVEAIRTGSLVDSRAPEVRREHSLRRMDWHTIDSITMERRLHIAEPLDGVPVWRVRTEESALGGYALWVRIVGEKVELLSLSRWIV